MEQQLDNEDLLAQFLTPAFIVRDNRIVQLNHAAKCQQLSLDTPLEALLGEHVVAYDAFTGGCLYLPLQLQDRSLGFCITRDHGRDLFVAEQDTDGDLRALGLASRELRHPLSNIDAGATKIIALLEQSGHAEDAARFNRSLHQLHRLICNMSDVSLYAVDCGSRHCYVDIGAIFDEVFEKSAVLAQTAGITLNYEGLREPAYGLADEVMIHRAVYNLISNSMKFTPKGGRIDAKLSLHGMRLHLTVSDSGSGISSELRSTMFSRYQREACIEDDRYGIGLGMVLIRSVVLSHGGTVLVEQPETQGAKITLTFKLRTSDYGLLKAPGLRTDYAGGRDHALQELSDVLPIDAYK